jgi:Lrp/AsnC family leucine-responsive transcriptional regulator
VDHYDAAILRLLQENCLLSIQEVSERVGLSPSACHRRMHALRHSGVIEREIAVVSPQAVGRPISMVLMVSLEREQADIIDAFKRSLAQTTEIMSAYYVTGEADFILVLTSRDMDDYDHFTRRFLYSNPNIKSFTTFVVIDRVKASLTVPVDVPAGSTDDGRSPVGGRGGRSSRKTTPRPLHRANARVRSIRT